MPAKFVQRQVMAETKPQAMVKKDRYSEGLPVWFKSRFDGTCPKI